MENKKIEQPQKYACADCFEEINEGEHKTFGVCDKCWEKAYPKKLTPPLNTDGVVQTPFSVKVEPLEVVKSDEKEDSALSNKVPKSRNPPAPPSQEPYRLERPVEGGVVGTEMGSQEQSAEEILRKHFDEDWPEDKGVRGTDESWGSFKEEQPIFFKSMIGAMEEYAQQFKQQDFIKLAESISCVSQEPKQDPQTARKETEEVFGGLRELIKDDAIYQWYLELIIQYKLNP